MTEIVERLLQTVVSKRATGTGDIGESLSLDSPFRLVFVRCHFTGSAGDAPMFLAVGSASGAIYNARLYRISEAGTSSDVNFRILPDGNQEPSPWTFQNGDTLDVLWTNPDPGNITWGLEVGLSLAS